MRRISIPLVLPLLFCSPLVADYAAGVAAYQAKNYSEAVTQFQQAIEELKVAGAEEDPQYQPYYLMLGNSLSKAGKLKEAVDPLKMALKMKDGDIGTQLALGQAYYKLNDYSNCARTLGSADVSALPQGTQGAISNMLSVCYEKSGDSGRALANMENAAKLNPNDAAAQFNYGSKALASGYTDDAVSYLEKAVSLDGNDPAKRRAYGSALVRKGRETQDRNAKKSVYSKAVANAQALVKMDSTYENTLTLAEVQIGAQDYVGAVSTLDNAIAKKSSDWLPYFYKGQAYTAEGQFANAVDPLTTSLTKGPGAKDKARVDNQLGFVYEKLREFEKSMVHYQAGGNSAGYDRVQENFKIAQDNQDADRHNAEVEELERQRKELEDRIKALPGATPPPSN